MFVLIDSYNKVLELAPQKFDVVGDGTWVQTESAPAIGDIYDQKTKAFGPDIAVLKASALASLRASCAAAIVGGYKSSALGAEHTYPSTSTDQTNMIGSVTASLLPGLASDWTTPFWCMDVDGNWAFCDHTAVQIQAAGEAGKAWVVECQEKLRDLSTSVLAASSAIDVQSISW